jgi:hypothetical protein
LLRFAASKALPLHRSRFHAYHPERNGRFSREGIVAVAGERVRFP